MEIPPIVQNPVWELVVKTLQVRGALEPGAHYILTDEEGQTWSV